MNRRHFHQLIASCALVLGLQAVANSEPQQCPADKAAERGYTAYDEFHKVMAPAWHTAWPAKEFAALFAAGQQFAEKIKAVDAVVPAMKSKSRAAKFLVARSVFDTLVATYSSACEKTDSIVVYELMPKVHDAFEMSGSLLGPIDFPHLEGILVTLDVIIEKHIPANNHNGLEASTATLSAKAEAFDSAMIPDDLKEFTPQVNALMSTINESCVTLTKNSGSKNLESYTSVCIELRKSISKFKEEWM